MIKKLIKKFIPKSLLSVYHLWLARLAAFVYKNPSQKLIVIGVTGTNGKTTTVNFISQYLECLGQKTGLASTVNFKVGDKQWLNNKKMTMLGRFQTQKLLSQMVRVGCRYAIIETSSQGIEQFRHVGINYDVALFTNLTPEHIEAHGGFDNYRTAKEKLFLHLTQKKYKIINNQKINKIIISNADDQETKRLKKFKADKFFTYGFDKPADFKINIKTDLLGEFNNYNILAALATISALGFDINQASQCRLTGVPGRQEFIDEGQNFKVLIDYAPEPVSLGALYKAIDLLPKHRLIHVLGSCGGGRDRARQPVMGTLAGQTADLVIVTNEDPYDDDPQEIINNIAKGALEAGKRENKDLFKILDRPEAIKNALELAQKDDLVLITGKGAEQYICAANGQKIPHDDREVVRNILKKL